MRTVAVWLLLMWILVVGKVVMDDTKKHRKPRLTPSGKRRKMAAVVLLLILGGIADPGLLDRLSFTVSSDSTEPVVDEFQEVEAMLAEFETPVEPQKLSHSTMDSEPAFGDSDSAPPLLIIPQDDQLYATETPATSVSFHQPVEEQQPLTSTLPLRIPARNRGTEKSRGMISAEEHGEAPVPAVRFTGTIQPIR